MVLLTNNSNIDQTADISISKSDEKSVSTFQIHQSGDDLEAITLTENLKLSIEAKNTASIVIFVKAEQCRGPKARFAQLVIKVGDKILHFPVFLQVSLSQPDSRADFQFSFYTLHAGTRVSRF